MPMIDAASISNLEKEVIVEEVLGLTRPQYTLRQLCKVIPMNKLAATVRVATQISASPKVEEFVEAPLQSQAYTKVNFNLWKNVTNVALSFEAEASSDVDVLKMHMDDAARSLAKLENSQIADIMAAATAIGGSDWGVKTGTPSQSTNDPMDDIMGAIGAILNQEKGYEPDYIAMHPLVYTELIANDSVRTYIERESEPVVKTGVLGKIGGLKIVQDVGLLNTAAYVVASKSPAIVLGDGPTASEDYKGRGAFYQGIAIAKWLEPQLVLGGAIRELTGVRA